MQKLRQWSGSCQEGSPEGSGRAGEGEGPEARRKRAGCFTDGQPRDGTLSRISSTCGHRLKKVSGSPAWPGNPTPQTQVFRQVFGYPLLTSYHCCPSWKMACRPEGGSPSVQAIFHKELQFSLGPGKPLQGMGWYLGVMGDHVFSLWKWCLGWEHAEDTLWRVEQDKICHLGVRVGAWAFALANW